jgi:ectoine hydroxylase-related dioxygenase (phytanoyl-CoA dioxygenase family)
LRFIKEFIKPLFNGEQIVYQKIPTFRVQLVGNLAVGQFHRDRDYNHGVDEINFWLPFVNVYGNNSIWVESKENENDFHPVKLDYGQILEFDGANLLHGNKINDSNSTRVSVDFRVVRYKDFKPSNKGSINMDSKFNIGGYFDLI